jgi:transposase
MLASGHEAILQRSKTQGAGRRRQRGAQGRSCKDLLGVDAHHQALYLKRRRETGDVEPKPIPGRPRLKGAALQEWLPSQLQDNNDLTLQEHSEAFEEEVGVVVSASTVGRAIARLPQGGWPIKKSRP